MGQGQPKGQKEIRCNDKETMNQIRSKRVSDPQESSDSVKGSPDSHNRSRSEETKYYYTPPYINLRAGTGQHDTAGTKKALRNERGGTDRHNAVPNSKSKSSNSIIRRIGDPADRTRRNMSVSKRAQLQSIGGTERTFGKLQNRYGTGLFEKERPTSQGRHTAKSTAPSTLIGSQKSRAPTSDYTFQDVASSKEGSMEKKQTTQLSYAAPTDEMVKRWIKIIRQRVPTIDLVDISAEIRPDSQKR